MANRYSPYKLHDHAGAMWLAPLVTALVFTVLGVIFMLVYPYLGIAGGL